MNKNAIIIVLMFCFAFQGCGLHQAVLINTYKPWGPINTKENGVLAFELFEPKDMETEFWAKNIQNGDRYQLDQYIDDGSSWKVSIGPITLFEQISLNDGTNKTIYLYQLPPGKYVLTYFRIKGTEYKDKRGYAPKIKTNEFTIEASNITYIGTTLLWGNWGTLGFGFNSKIEFKSVDWFTQVDSILKLVIENDINKLKTNKQFTPIEFSNKK